MKFLHRLAFVAAMLCSLTASADFNINYAGTIFNYLLGGEGTLRICMPIPGEMATKLDGNELTEISFGCTMNNEDVGGSVFVMENGKIVNEKRLDNFSDGPLFTISLDTPYKIKKGVPFVFGYCVDKVTKGANAATTDYPLGVSKTGLSAFGGYIELLENGQVIGSADVYENSGYYTALSAYTTGPVDQIINMLRFTSIGLNKNNNSMPTYGPGDKPTVTIAFENLGSNKISSLDLTMGFEGQEPTTVTKNYSLKAMGGTKKVSLSAPEAPHGCNLLSVTISKPDGDETFEPITAQVNIVALNEGEGFSRRMLAEEGTGTWCGWCPRGLAGMDQMAEENPNQFVGIAAHSGDQFQVDSYTPVIALFEGFPSVIINRDPRQILDPAYANLKSAFNKNSAQPVVGDIALTVNFVEEGRDIKALHAYATSTFCVDHAVPEGYAVAFAITEDGLKGQQNNYYSGSVGLDWWVDQAPVVNWTYMDTARDIFDALGHPASIVKEVKADEQYKFDLELPLNNVTDPLNTAVTAILLDRASGVAVNSIRVKAENYGTEESTGIEEVSVAPHAAAGCYDLYGRRVAEGKVAAGQIYITVDAAGKAVKRIKK